MSLPIRRLAPLAVRISRYLPLCLLAVGCAESRSGEAPAAARADAAGVVAFVDVNVVLMDQERVIEGRR